MGHVLNFWDVYASCHFDVLWVVEKSRGLQVANKKGLVKILYKPLAVAHQWG
jgi:hypothetical protein